jgi:hypothetical protein
MTWRSLVPASVEALLRSVDRYMQKVAIEMGNGKSFNKAQVGVYFGNSGVEEEDPYFGGVGPRRTGRIGRGNCSIGCRHNAKNKLTCHAMAKTRDYVFTEYGQW